MTQNSKPIDRILARKVVHRGLEYGLSLIEIFTDDVSIEPFEAETHSTRFVDGTIRILRSGYTGPTDWYCSGDRPVVVIE